MIKCRLRSQVTTKLFAHKDPQVDREFANVYRALTRVDMGNFSWNHDKENRRLVLQVVDEDTGEFRALLQITEDGVMSAAGAATYSTTVEGY